VLPRIIQFVTCFEEKLLPLLRDALTKLPEAEWFQNLIGGGIENLQNNLDDPIGIVAVVGGGAVLAGILSQFFTYQTALIRANHDDDDGEPISFLRLLPAASVF
jgi:hypothetical protein